MTNRDADKISALVDDELAGWEVNPVVKSLRHDPGMQECWRNYHLIGDAMRGALPRHVKVDLSERILEALEKEPVFINPRADQAPVSTGTHPRSKATIGFALAASMTAIAVFGVTGIDQGAGPDGTAAGIVIASPQPQVSVEAEPMLTSLMAELDAAETRAEADGGQQWIRIQTVSGRPGALPGGSPNLYDYLMNYTPQSVHARHDDPLSYLRVVSHGSQ